MFNMEWLDACSQKVSFEGGAIHHILAEVNNQMSFKVRGEFSNALRQQVIQEEQLLKYRYNY